jgi:putative transposase
VKGRKRFLVVDTLGLPISIQIRAASVQERDGGPSVIADAKRRDPRLALVWGDSGFTGRCVDIVQRESGITLEIVKRPNEGDTKRWALEGIIPELPTPAFKVIPWRWVVERTFGWLGRYRRLTRDFEATVESSLAWIQIAFIRLLVQRFGEVLA